MIPTRLILYITCPQLQCHGLYLVLRQPPTSHTILLYIYLVDTTSAFLPVQQHH